MRIKSMLAGAVSLAFAGAACAEAPSYSLLGDWPVKLATDSGVELGLRGNLSYDYNRFGDDRLPNGGERFVVDDAWRRQELNAFLRKPGVFDVAIGYDFKSKVWLDNFLRLSNEVGGDLRIGQFKTPVGYEESAVGTTSTTFLERSLPASMVYQGRRLGVDWTYEKLAGWYFNAALMTGGDLQGDNDGRTLGARVVFNPLKTDSDVIHLGVAASNEKHDDDSARLRVRPEAFLTDVRLVDSGALGRVETVDRLGLEAIWQHGPLLVQGEYLRIDVEREGLNDYSADGYYVSAARVLTGEKRSYKSAAFGNVKPKHGYGAVELAARYSHVDLDDRDVSFGGRQSDWTVGVNWYIGQHFKLQANYVMVDSKRRGIDLDPNIAELRLQIYF
ncbi:OprO/OprP family phosphate-selective porin [Lysobacter sp. CA199]|uniref:OprO/OprP family phosphate-selective porin n=1 Tax=Lysobacter sp. CA199 TaxID=3455608 RepID=UPI003F8D3E71